MPAFSASELQNSPQDQLSTAVRTYYWNPAPDFDTGTTFSSPFARAYKYDAFYPADTQDVSSTVIGTGSPFMGSGVHANQIGVVLQNLAPGYEYRIVLWCTASDGSTPSNFFRVKCVY